MQQNWKKRIPPVNPDITDPVWPGDPFWRATKYTREFRAKIAHEFHHSPAQPNVRQLSEKYGLRYDSVAAWCYAFPYGSRELPCRNYVSPAQNFETNFRARAEAKAREYARELHDHAQNADLTWFLMGDPLPSRAANNQKQRAKIAKKISLPNVHGMFTSGLDA